MGHTFAADSEHVADELLSHRQVAIGQAIHRQQQPATQLLVDGMLPVADRGLGNLGNRRSVQMERAEQAGKARAKELDPAVNRDYSKPTK